MKKKVLASLMVVAMTAAMLAGCGGGDKGSTPSDSQQEAPADDSAGGSSDDAGSDDAQAPADDAGDDAEAEKPSGDTPTIAFVPKVMGQAWWDYVQKNVEEWAADTGIEVIYKGPTEVDAAAQVKIMTDLVNQGVDILCFSPNDPAACEAICKEARDKGIIVISTEASGMENIDYDVEAFDETGLGGFLMDQLAEQMGKSGQYITMVGSMTMESQNNWADAAVARQKDAYPDMELVPDARVENGSDAEKAYQLTKEMIQKYPDLKGILGTGSFDAPGAARAIQELGLTGKVFAISVAMPLEVKDYLQDGTLGSVALWDPGVSAKVMLNLGVKMFNGEEIAAGADLGEEGYNAVDIQGKVIVGQGQIAVTMDNVDDFGF
ncbi:MAG: substrate-binding domain-containing protein [Lachnospiraceae bacterium]|jgi:simple sugar transport system substrate-binding protein|nr:substrate-binding domain-containing protein [Lachnospiraceae bacterium]